MLARGTFQRARDVFRGGWADGAVDSQHEHRRAVRGR
jgi:hypothetical protein